jgi:hypothetical protein
VSYATLSWSGATTKSVDIYRNGTLRVTTGNTGSHQDEIGRGSGSVTYQVCEADSSTACSATITVVY